MGSSLPHRCGACVWELFESKGAGRARPATLSGPPALPRAADGRPPSRCNPTPPPPPTPQPPQVTLWTSLDLDCSVCPLDAEPASGGEPPAASSSSRAYTVWYPERAPRELLDWCAAACAADPGGALLQFPPSLSKRERAEWHGLAQRAGLATESRGVGEGRHLTISLAAAAEAADGGSSRQGGRSAHLTAAQRRRAQAIYACAQAEGGSFWELSHGEVEAMVASGQPLPSELQAVVDKQCAPARRLALPRQRAWVQRGLSAPPRAPARRERAQEACRLLRAGDPNTALELLLDDPKLAHVRDDATGGFPVHIAAWQVGARPSAPAPRLCSWLWQRSGSARPATADSARRRAMKTL